MRPVHCSCANGSQGLRHKSPKAPSARQSSKAANNTSSTEGCGRGMFKSNPQVGIPELEVPISLVNPKVPSFRGWQERTLAAPELCVFHFFQVRNLRGDVRTSSCPNSPKRGTDFHERVWQTPSQLQKPPIRTAEGLLLKSE